MLIPIGKFAEMTGVSTQTLRRMDYEGKLIPVNKLPSGKRFYSEDQLKEFNIAKKKVKRKVIGYCRVSTNKQKDDLQRQVENVKTYMISNGYSFDIIEDIGSGINYNKKGLKTLIKMVLNNEVEKIVILYKDRLVRFGFELIENICNEFNTEIEIIDNSKKTNEEEVVEDLIQIITVFSCKLQGKRHSKTNKIIKELKDDNTNKES